MIEKSKTNSKANGRTLYERIQQIVSQKLGDAKEHIYYTGNIVINFPREKGRYHGSSFVIQPVHCYNIDGDAVTPIEITDDVIKELKGKRCNITDVHKYLSESNITRDKEKLADQSHIHFKCNHMSDDEIVKILKILPELK